MLQESPTIPHGLAQLLGLLLASSLGWIGGWITRRKREPVEIAKLKAETRNLDVTTDLSLMKAASEALTNSLRVVEQRDHWQRRAGDLLREVRQHEDQAKLDELQLRKMTAHRDLLKSILEERNINFPDWDGKWNGRG